MKRLGRGVGRAVLLWLLWWGLAHPADPWDLAVGGLAAALAAALVEAAHGVDPARFRLETVPRGLVLGLPRALLRDVVRLALRLWDDLLGDEREGAFRTVPFDANGGDVTSDSERTLVTFAVSVLPNSFVLGIDRDSGRILVHELEPGAGDRLLPR
ncbi:MAG TPA: Na+/H+ antiporter subunit E [Longimicrobiales bacterium]|nr:Na+/H+ antiporter subunit E [Longimicrobiales bacterium]